MRSIRTNSFYCFSSACGPLEETYFQNIILLASPYIYKSNSTADAALVETNLQGQLGDHLHWQKLTLS